MAEYTRRRLAKMSFDIHLQCFRNGEPATFKRALVEEIFGRHAINFHLPLTGVNYADRGGAEIYGADDGDDIQSLMFNSAAAPRFSMLSMSWLSARDRLLFGPPPGVHIVRLPPWRRSLIFRPDSAMNRSDHRSSSQGALSSMRVFAAPR